MSSVTIIQYLSPLKEYESGRCTIKLQIELGTELEFFNVIMCTNISLQCTIFIVLWSYTYKNLSDIIVEQTWAF